MPADTGSGACAKYKHRFFHEPKSLLALKPSFWTELSRVFAEDSFIKLRDHCIHTDLGLH
jgi:hypothetical protein